jgi:hypothetical protein
MDCGGNVQTATIRWKKCRKGQSWYPNKQIPPHLNNSTTI